MSQIALAVENTADMKSSRKSRGGTDYLLKCEECGHVHTVQIRPPRPVTIPFILGEGAHSRVADIEIDDDEELHVGDIFEHDDASWKLIV